MTYRRAMWLILWHVTLRFHRLSETRGSVNTRYACSCGDEWVF